MEEITFGIFCLAVVYVCFWAIKNDDFQGAKKDKRFDIYSKDKRFDIYGQDPGRK